MDKSTIIKLAEEYAKLVLQNIKPIEIILYGSYAKGTAREGSDIDIAVIVSEVIHDFLDEATLLYRLRHQIDNRIEPKLIVESHDCSGFLEDVRKTGYRLYSAA
jgi:predicted nucleotidyltransferase